MRQLIDILNVPTKLPGSDAPLKTASVTHPDTLYHGTSSANRASILERGLLHPINSGEGGEGYGVFFSTHAEPARPGMDEWAVDVRGIDLVLDDTTDVPDVGFGAEPGEVWYVSYDAEIPPNRLTLMPNATKTAATQLTFPESARSTPPDPVSMKLKHAPIRHSSLPTFNEFVRREGGLNKLLDSMGDARQQYMDRAEMDHPDFEAMSPEEQEEIYYGYMSDRFDEVMWDHDSHTFPLVLFREVKLPNIDALRTEGIGNCWSWNEHAAEAHWAQGTGENYMLRAEVAEEAIDWDMTIFLNLDPSTGEDEKEIRLHEGAKIELTGWRLSSDDQWQVPKQRIVTAATKTAAVSPEAFTPCIAVDLDGTIALIPEDGDYSDPTRIGAPIPAMIEKIKSAISQGETFVVFTARLADKENADVIRKAIGDYTEEHIGTRLDGTNEKTPGMKEFWDDRAKGVAQDMGKFASAKLTVGDYQGTGTIEIDAPANRYEEVCYEIATNDTLWNEIGEILTGGDIDGNPTTFTKFKELFNSIPPFVPYPSGGKTLYRGEPVRKSDDEQTWTGSFREILSWGSNYKLAAIYAEGSHGIVWKTVGPVQGVEVMDIFDWRNWTHQQESNYPAVTGHWLILSTCKAVEAQPPANYVKRASSFPSPGTILPSASKIPDPETADDAQSLIDTSDLDATSFTWEFQYLPATEIVKRLGWDRATLEMFYDNKEPDEELLESIDANGIQKAIVILDGFAEGNHRLAVALMRGHQRVPVYIGRPVVEKTAAITPVELVYRWKLRSTHRFELQVSDIERANHDPADYVIGHLLLKEDDYDHSKVFVEDVDVDRHYQRQGIGMKLYMRAIEFARKKGFKVLSQGTPRTPEAEALWGKLKGMYPVETGEYGDFINLDGVVLKTAAWDVEGPSGALGLRQDNPALRYPDERENGLRWLASHPRTTTAWYDSVMVPTAELVKLPGARNEHLSPDQDRVDELTTSMFQEGFRKGNEPLIVVEANGEVKIYEGNHRVRAALAAGIDEIPVTVKYWGGSEELPGVWDPVNFSAGASKTATAEISTLTGPDHILSWTEFVDWAADGHVERLVGELSTNTYADVKDPKQAAILERRYAKAVTWLTSISYPCDVFRVIRLQGVDKMRWNDAGTSWSISEAKAQNVYGLLNQGDDYLFKGTIREDAVDIQNTLYWAMSPMHTAERELRLKDGAKISEVSMRKKKGGKWEPAPQRTMTAAVKTPEPTIYRDTMGKPHPEATIFSVLWKDRNGTIEPASYFTLQSRSDCPKGRWSYESTTLEALRREFEAKGWAVKASRAGNGTGDPCLHMLHKPTLAAQRKEQKDQVKWEAIAEKVEVSGEPCFVRLGDMPEGGVSKNWQTDENEPGVSVIHAMRGDGVCVILPNNDRLAQTLSRLTSSRHIYVVTGREVGTGSDGEPCLVDCTSERISDRVFIRDSRDASLKLAGVTSTGADTNTPAITLKPSGSYKAPESALDYPGTQFEKFAILRDGKPVGEIEVQVSSKVVTVRNALIYRAEDTGGGIGKAAFRILPALFKGKKVQSCFDQNVVKGVPSVGISDQATLMFQSLMRSGEVEKKQQGGRTYYVMTGRNKTAASKTYGPVYHGTKATFAAGDIKPGPEGLIWFSSSREFAERWGPNIVEATLTIKNPDTYVDGGLHMAMLDDAEEVAELAKEFDGVIVSNPSDSSLPTNYAVFSAAQVSVVPASKTASPDFGYDNFNDRDHDLDFIKFKVEFDMTGDFTVHAFMENKSQGYVSCVEEEWEGERAACVSWIEINTEWKGTGLGQLLYDNAIQAAKKKGFLWFTSDDHLSQEAISAWGRLMSRYKVVEKEGEAEITDTDFGELEEDEDEPEPYTTPRYAIDLRTVHKPPTKLRKPKLLQPKAAQTVFHGTPYKVDTFTTKYIGKGDGSQTFGWGLYFAGNKAVGEHYRNNNAEYAYLIDGVPTSPQDHYRYGIAQDIAMNGEWEAGIHARENGRLWLEAFESMRGKKVEEFRGGNLYEAEIPEDTVMLSWDKPLEQQPESVKAALDAKYAGMTGSQIYAAVAKEQGSEKAASGYLHTLGIKGVQYLDAYSRALGEGTSNYVVFDEKDVKHARKITAAVRMTIPMKIRAYHGTTASFDTFTTPAMFHVKRSYCENLIAGHPDGRIVTVDLTLTNPADLVAMHISPSDPTFRSIVTKLEGKGFDSAQYRQEAWIAFRPEQIRVVGTSKTAKEKEIAGDHTNEDGYWAGTGNAASGILPIARDTKRICLAWRSEEVHTGDCYGTIGGAVQHGKSPEDSAKAEMKEEVGYAGSIETHSAYVFKDKSFSYFNFVGVVDSEFEFNPGEEHAWETDFIEWRSLAEWVEDMKTNPGDYHPEILNLFKESKDLIERLAGSDEEDADEDGPPKVNTAAQGILFHCSPTAQRASIEQHGIDPSRFKGSRSTNGKGFYGFRKLKDAEWYASYWAVSGWPNEAFDVWEATVHPDSFLDTDETLFEGSAESRSAKYCDMAAGPQDIRLIGTYDPKKGWDPKPKPSRKASPEQKPKLLMPKDASLQSEFTPDEVVSAYANHLIYGSFTDPEKGKNFFLLRTPKGRLPWTKRIFPAIDRLVRLWLAPVGNPGGRRWHIEAAEPGGTNVALNFEWNGRELVPVAPERPFDKQASRPTDLVYYNTNSSNLDTIKRDGFDQGSFANKPIDFGGDVCLAVSKADLPDTDEHQYGVVTAYEPRFEYTSYPDDGDLDQDGTQGVLARHAIPADKIYVVTRRGKIISRLSDYDTTSKRAAAETSVSLTDGRHTLRLGDATLSYEVKVATNRVDLHSVRVVQRARRKGEARAAMGAFLSAVDDAGFEVELVSSPLDKKTGDLGLRRFYESLGFRDTGRRANFVGDPYMLRPAKTRIAPATRPKLLTASPDFGYTQFNDRDADLAKLKFTLKRDGYGFAIEARMPGETEMDGYIDFYPGDQGEMIVGAVYLLDDKWLGTGLGQMLYDRAIVASKKKGMTRFYSGTVMSPEAHKAWKRLAQRYPVTTLSYEERHGDPRGLTEEEQANSYFIDLTKVPVIAKAAFLSPNPSTKPETVYPEGSAGWSMFEDQRGDNQSPPTDKMLQELTT